jgi:hypothetical protein
MKPYYQEVLAKRVPGKELIYELARRVKRRLVGEQDHGRQVWTPADVIDADGPELSLRSYLEHRDIRRVIAKIPEGRRRRAMEVGIGFGRLVVVLREFFPEVWGVEREPGLLDIARELLPEIRYANPASIDDLSAVPGPVDFALIFTVLMHMTDADARKVLDAMKEKARNGWILVAERTDAGEVYGDNSDSAKFMAHGRSIETFTEWMKPFRLVDSFPRTVEPTYRYSGQDGTYMLFQDA